MFLSFSEIFFLAISALMGLLVSFILLDFLDKEVLHMGSSALACLPVPIILGPFIGIFLGSSVLNIYGTSIIPTASLAMLIYIFRRFHL